MEMNPEADSTRPLRSLADARQGLPWTLRISFTWLLARAGDWHLTRPASRSWLPMARILSNASVS